LKKSLTDLQLTYIDLYLIHWPVSTVDPTTNKMPPLHKTWPQLEKLHKDGLIKNIGVSNFNVQILLDLLSYAEVKPVVN